MNAPNSEHLALLDRLVDGELSSEERRAAMAWKNGRSSARPAKNTMKNASAALATAPPRDAASAPASVVCPSTGMMTMSGTVVTSWNTDMATASRPCAVCSSFCSVSWRLMTVVEDCANTAPTTKETAGERPASQASSPTTAVVSTTCAVPSTSTVWRSACNWGSE